MHIGVERRAGQAHSAVVTAANVYDKHPLLELVHGNQQRLYSDNAYPSRLALIRLKELRAKDFMSQRLRRRDRRGCALEESKRLANPS